MNLHLFASKTCGNILLRQNLFSSSVTFKELSIDNLFVSINKQIFVD